MPLYKELSEVERALADLKDVLDMRPIYHQTDTACGRTSHRKEAQGRTGDLSATETLTALKSVRVVNIDLGDGTTKRSVTAGTDRAAMVLRAQKSIYHTRHGQVKP